MPVSLAFKVNGNLLLMFRISYGNIGIKVLYSNIGIDLLGFPPLHSYVGKISFALLVPIYWCLA